MTTQLLAAALAATLLAVPVLASARAAGAAAAADKDPHLLSAQDRAMLRTDIRSQKNQLMAQNLTLTDTDATTFSPLDDPYAAQVKINDKKYATVQQYADQCGTLTDAQASSRVKQWLDVDIAVTQLRARYLPIVSAAIGGTKGATWAQLDRRLPMMVDLQLSARTPLVQAQGK
jgi:hypothetical protein